MKANAVRIQIQNPCSNFNNEIFSAKSHNVGLGYETTDKETLSRNGHGMFFHNAEVKVLPWSNN